MKNKHNTMNANSSQKTYINMQNHLIRFPNDECYLVEVLAPKSRNITWEIMVDKKHCTVHEGRTARSPGGRHRSCARSHQGRLS